jgi:hypothetical protein
MNEAPKTFNLGDVKKIFPSRPETIKDAREMVREAWDKMSPEERKAELSFALSGEDHKKDWDNLRPEDQDQIFENVVQAVYNEKTPPYLTPKERRMKEEHGVDVTRGDIVDLGF